MDVMLLPKNQKCFGYHCFRTARNVSPAAWLVALGVSACSVSEHEIVRLDAASDDTSVRDTADAARDVSVSTDGDGGRDTPGEGYAADRRDASTDGDTGGMGPADAIIDNGVRDSNSDAIAQPDGSPEGGIVDGTSDRRDIAADSNREAGADATADTSLDAIQDVAIDGPGDVVGEQDARIVGTDIWAVGRAGVVLHRTQGTAWAFETRPPTTANFFDIWGTDRTNVWAVGDGDILHYDGTMWTSIANPVPQSRLSAIWGSSASDVWAVGYHVAQARGLILRYNGTSWSDQAGGPTVFDQQSFVSVWGSGPRDVWVVGSGKVFHFGANSSWTEVALPDAGADGLAAVWTSSATQGWMMGQAGQIMQLTASGWSPMPSYPDEPSFKAISGLSPNDVWAIAWATPLQVENRFYRNTGSGWTDGPPAMLPLMYDIFMRSSQDVWFAGFDGVIAHYNGVAITADPTVPTQETLHGIWGPR
jgi:hypothetical protein